MTLLPQADPFEEHDQAASQPAVVAELLAKLQKYNDSHCNGQHCEPDGQRADAGPRGAPTTVNGLKVWIPWRGNPDPSACDTNRTAATAPHGGGGGGGGMEGPDPRLAHAEGGACTLTGWVSGPNFSGPSLLVQLLIDGAPHGGLVPADVKRLKAGPHGYILTFPCATIAAGKHRLDVAAHKAATGPVVHTSTVCTANGQVAACVDSLP